VNYLSLPRETVESTREDRALEPYALGRHIHQLAEDLFDVPSSCGKKTYLVRFQEETCTCPNAVFNPGIRCKHILMIGIAHARRRAQRSYRRKRSHTFDCSSCGSRLPLVQAVVVGAEQASWTAFCEGELVCGPCGRAEGVI